MRFLAGLRRTCDVCFYFAFTSFAALLFGGSSLFPALPFFAAAAFLSALLAGKGPLQFAPLVLLAGAFLVIPLRLASVLFLVPACAYMAYSVAASRKGGFGHFEYDGVFKAFLLVSFPLVGIVLLAGQRAMLEASFFPFAVVFLAGSFLLLRMQRHDAQSLRERRFVAVNAMAAAGVALVGLALGSGWFFLLLGAAIVFIWTRVIVPILIFIAYPFARFLNWLGFLPDETDGDFLGNLHPGVEQYFFEEDDEFYYELYADLVARYGVFVAIALGALLAFLLLRVLLKIRPGLKTATALETRQALASGKSRAKRKRRDGRIDSQIRETYRKFLRHCGRDGIAVMPHMTSLDVEIEAAQRLGLPQSGELREIYAKARYGGGDGDRHDARKARELLRGIKAAFARRRGSGVDRN